MRGRLDELVIDSVALRGNPLNDPSVRPLWVYSPPGDVAGTELPVIYLIQGFTGQLDMWRNRSSQRLTAIELMPVAQFPGSRNWGYDGVQPYAPPNSFGGPDSPQRLVDAPHA